MNDFHKERAALLVMDYQSTILDNLPDSDQLLSRVAGAIALARGSGMQLGFVRVAFTDSDYAAIPDTNKSFSALAKRGHFLDADAPKSAIHDYLAPASGDIVVRKTRVGAFSTTDLDHQLRARDINTLILAGVSTSGVVRAAADMDYRVFVLSDGCADPNSEVHDLLMRQVFPRQADIITIADLPELLQAG